MSERCKALTPVCPKFSAFSALWEEHILSVVLTSFQASRGRQPAGGIDIILSFSPTPLHLLCAVLLNYFSCHSSQHMATSFLALSFTSCQQCSTLNIKAFLHDLEEGLHVWILSNVKKSIGDRCSHFTLSFHCQSQYAALQTFTHLSLPPTCSRIIIWSYNNSDYLSPKRWQLVFLVATFHM